MKRQRESTRCVALRTRERQTGRPVREFRCYPSDEAELLQRRQLGDSMAEYDTEDECEASCGTLTMLPAELGARVLGAVPLPTLPALARLSRGMRERVAPDIRDERRALCAIQREYPLAARGNVVQITAAAAAAAAGGPGAPPALVPIRRLCAGFALPCVRPYRELVNRLWHELVLPLRPSTRNPTVGAMGYGYASRDIAALPGNASFVARGSVLPSRQADPMVLLPGETVRLPGNILGGADRVLYLRPSASALSISTLFPDQLLVLTCDLQAVRPSGPPDADVVVNYVVPPPGGVTPVGRGRALRDYLSAAEELLGIPDGRLSLVVPEGAAGPYYDIDVVPGENPWESIAATVRRTGMPVDIVTVRVAEDGA